MIPPLFILLMIIVALSCGLNNSLAGIMVRKMENVPIKELCVLAESGNRDAILQIAKLCRDRSVDLDTEGMQFSKNTYEIYLYYLSIDDDYEGVIHLMRSAMRGNPLACASLARWYDREIILTEHEFLYEVFNRYNYPNGFVWLMSKLDGRGLYSEIEILRRINPDEIFNSDALKKYYELMFKSSSEEDKMKLAERGWQTNTCMLEYFFNIYKNSKNYEKIYEMVCINPDMNINCYHQIESELSPEMKYQFACAFVSRGNYLVHDLIQMLIKGVGTPVDLPRAYEIAKKHGCLDFYPKLKPKVKHPEKTVPATCPVCLDTHVNAFTQCGHPICMECAVELGSDEIKCPLCKADTKYFAVYV